jgi:hypothetical protein
VHRKARCVQAIGAAQKLEQQQQAEHLHDACGLCELKNDSGAETFCIICSARKFCSRVSDLRGAEYCTVICCAFVINNQHFALTLLLQRIYLVTPVTCRTRAANESSILCVLHSQVCAAEYCSCCSQPLEVTRCCADDLAHYFSCYYSMVYMNKLVHFCTDCM